MRLAKGHFNPHFCIRYIPTEQLVVCLSKRVHKCEKIALIDSIFARKWEESSLVNATHGKFPVKPACTKVYRHSSHEVQLDAIRIISRVQNGFVPDLSHARSHSVMQSLSSDCCTANRLHRRFNPISRVVLKVTASLSSSQ